MRFGRRGRDSASGAHLNKFVFGGQERNGDPGESNRSFDEGNDLEGPVSPATTREEVDRFGPPGSGVCCVQEVYRRAPADRLLPRNGNRRRASQEKMAALLTKGSQRKN